jgi:hypothetical protein
MLSATDFASRCFSSIAIRSAEMNAQDAPCRSRTRRCRARGSCSSHQICALGRHVSSRTALREHASVKTEARASMRAGVCPPHHRPVAGIDVAIIVTGRRGDHDPRLVDDRSTSLRDQPF